MAINCSFISINYHGNFAPEVVVTEKNGEMHALTLNMHHLHFGGGGEIGSAIPRVTASKSNVNHKAVTKSLTRNVLDSTDGVRILVLSCIIYGTKEYLPIIP